MRLEIKYLGKEINVFFFFLILYFSHQGLSCSEPCPAGLWGRHCNKTCFKLCPNSDTCLRETGACVCRPGFWGVTCQNSEHFCLQPDMKQKWCHRQVWSNIYVIISQNAELELMVNSAVRHAHRVDSHTAATM